MIALLSHNKSQKMSYISMDDVHKLTRNGDDGREQEKDTTEKKEKRKRTRNRSVLERYQCKKCDESIDDARRSVMRVLMMKEEKNKRPILEKVL